MKTVHHLLRRRTKERIPCHPGTETMTTSGSYTTESAKSRTTEPAAFRTKKATNCDGLDTCEFRCISEGRSPASPSTLRWTNAYETASITKISRTWADHGDRYRLLILNGLLRLAYRRQAPGKLRDPHGKRTGFPTRRRRGLHCPGIPLCIKEPASEKSSRKILKIFLFPTPPFPSRWVCERQHKTALPGKEKTPIWLQRKPL